MRHLSASLAAVLASRNRQPAYKIYAWDPDMVTISQVVRATSCTDPNIPAPLDLTPFCSSVSWNDRQLQFNLTDPDSLFHPDTGDYRSYLRDAAIIRLVEGDETIDEKWWVITFTGQIHGQIGWKTSRRAADQSARISAYGRGETQAYKRRKITTREYTVGTDIGIALSDICEGFMGLSDQERRIPSVLGRQFQHKTNQLSQVTPWEGISGLLEVICYVPFFDGEGKLSYINKNLVRDPDKILPNYVTVTELEVPENNQDAVNKVVVTFLDANLEQVDGPRQKLGTASVTTGFFSMHETLPCWWSDDHKQRAHSTLMKIVKSVNSGLLPVGTEEYTEVDEFHGQIDITISVWVPILATVMLATFLLTSKIPDKTTPTVVTVPGPGTGLSTGPGGGPVGGVITVNPTSQQQYTISVGRVLNAASLAGILVIMMSIGSAQYELWGTPYDMAYLEKQSIAMLDGLDYWQENEKEIKNDFIGSHDQSDAVALTNLIWEQTQFHTRKVLIEDDPSLEVGDMLTLPDGRTLIINALSKTIKRGDVSMLTIDGGKILTV